jgi:hypothetical protein
VSAIAASVNNADGVATMSAQTAVASVQEAQAGSTKPDTDIASDRLEGAEAIRDFISPKMPMRTARRLILDGIWPAWREGRMYVGSKTALREHWAKMTRGFAPKPNHAQADATGPEV